MTPPEEIEDFLPCIDCIVMAMCNALMQQPESKLGKNAYELYRKCGDVKGYIDEHFVTKVDDLTWRTSLRPIHNFFMNNTKFCEPHVISDHKL